MGKRKINPCKNKGMYQRKHSGRRYPYGISQSACECSKAFPSIVPLDFEPLRFAMHGEKSKTPRKLIELRGKEKPPPGSICLVPCNEAFRFRLSNGTRRYKKLYRRFTKFRGCQQVEEDLVKEKLLSQKPIETVSAEDILAETSSREDTFQLPDSDSFLTSYAERAAFLMELALDEEKRESVKYHKEGPSLKSPLSTVAWPPPSDMRDSKLRELFENDYFKEYPKLQVAAFIMTRYYHSGAHTEPDYDEEFYVRRIAPTFPYQELQLLKSDVGVIVGAYLSDYVQKFEEFLKKLSPKQLEALTKVYLDNEEELSQKEVAKKMQISLSSLRNRLDGIEPKLVEAFSPINPIPRKDRNKRIRYTSDLQEDGFYRTSSSKRKHPVKVTNMKTGEVTLVTPPWDDHDEKIQKKNYKWVPPWGLPQPKSRTDEDALNDRLRVPAMKKK